MTERLYVTVIQTCASLAACSLFASLIPDIRVVHQQKSTDSMPSSLPVLSMMANCVAWGLYGLLIDDYFPLVATNLIGLAFSLCYLIVYYQNEKYKKRLRLEIFVTILVLLGLISYPSVAGFEGVNERTIQDVVGFVTIIVSMVMFGSPLVLVKRVIQERSTELLPLTMVIAGAVNCVLWLAYGLLLDNLFVVVPNAANLLLGIMQLMLFCIYPRSRTYDSVEPSSSKADLKNTSNHGEGTKKGFEKTSTIDTDEEMSSVDEESQAKIMTSEQSTEVNISIEVHQKG
ncbi:putative SWEET sugar transporter [Plasmopara halstedii]